MLAHAAPGNVLPKPPNKPLKPTRPGFGPAAEPPGPNSTCAASRHLQVASRYCQLLGGKRRAALASARGTGRTAYTKDVRWSEVVARLSSA